MEKYAMSALEWQWPKICKTEQTESQVNWNCFVSKLCFSDRFSNSISNTPNINVIRFWCQQCSQCVCSFVNVIRAMLIWYACKIAWDKEFWTRNTFFFARPAKRYDFVYHATRYNRFIHKFNSWMCFVLAHISFPGFNS